MSHDDKLLLLEGQLKEAIAASRTIRKGAYPLRDRPQKVSALTAKLKKAHELAKSM